MEQEKKAGEKAEEFNNVVDATSQFLKAISLPVVNLWNKVKPKKKSDQRSDEVTAD